MKAISVRQPWAWAIIHAGKDIENRDWASRYRGPLLIHAAKGMTVGEYQAAAFHIWCVRQDLRVPLRGELLRGGVIGVVDMVDCVSRSDSPWFGGRYGFVLRNARPLPFREIRGELGLFNVPDRFAEAA